MGCRQSTYQDESNTRSLTNVTLAVMADGLPDPAPPAPTDARLPLDARQVFKLKKSWKGIKRCMADTGVEMFIRMFKANANIKELFTNFRNIKTDDELRMNETLETHATSVMGTFDEIISNIDNVDYVLELLKVTGSTHVGMQGFRPEFVLVMEQPFLNAVKITLGDRYTDYMDNIYKITIKFLLRSFIEQCGVTNSSNSCS